MLKLLKTCHFLSRYELDLVRQALKDKAKRTDNEQDKMMCWQLFDRLNREYKAQRNKK